MRVLIKSGYNSRAGTIGKFHGQPFKLAKKDQKGTFLVKNCGYNSRAGTIQIGNNISIGAGTIRERVQFKSG